jgi:hypothetical protein
VDERAAAEPSSAIFTTTNGNGFVITNDQGGVFCFAAAAAATSLQLVQTTRSELGAKPKDGIGLSAMTKMITGIANLVPRHVTCIGGGGADVVLSSALLPSAILLAQRVHSSTALHSLQISSTSQANRTRSSRRRKLNDRWHPPRTDVDTLTAFNK